MDLIRESFLRLFPEKEFFYHSEIEYNRRLSDFNANIMLRNNHIKVHLNLQWKDIDEEIKIGLIQSLLLKVLKRKKNNTQNIELYNNFVRNIPILTPKTRTDPLLEASFQRVNEKFFENSLEKPNFSWGQKAHRKLASYNFHNDAVTVSNIFSGCSEEILDYLMYHELLHKFHKFRHHNGRSSFHTPAFRQDESKFPGHKEIEKQIELIIRNSRRKNSINNFWNFLK